MLTKRIIACLDVKDGMVVKGVKFRNHQILGSIPELAEKYSNQGIDELVFYDITASASNRTVDTSWVEQVAMKINMPFCVAGGIKNIESAKRILGAGADKISINSPALENPKLIENLANVFGEQCIVVGIDSMKTNGNYYCWKYTGCEDKAKSALKTTESWILEVQKRGAGEIVLNCMKHDGTNSGFDIVQTAAMRKHCKVPLIASGGAGKPADFTDIFIKANVDGALAAGILHRNEYSVGQIKSALSKNGVRVRL